MSQRFQAFLLRNTTGLQYLVNERLAKRSGFIGSIAKRLHIGERQYSQHTFARIVKVANYFWVVSLQSFAHMRYIGSRIWATSQKGPLNYSGFFMYVWVTHMIMSRIVMERPYNSIHMNAQDKPVFWFQRYMMMFPPGFLHNRMSAHYLEITHIYAVEMFKRYQVARKEILAEREKCDDKEKRTRYALNPNYIYEPLGKDSDKIGHLKSTGVF